MFCVFVLGYLMWMCRLKSNCICDVVRNVWICLLQYYLCGLGEIVLAVGACGLIVG